MRDEAPSKAVTSDTTDRRASGALFRGYVASLNRLGLFSQVLARVDPETARLMTHPPLPTSRIDVRRHEAVMNGALEAGGAKAVRQMGYETARDAAGPVITPVIKTLIALFGATPATLFSRMDRIGSAFLKGLQFDYTPRDERGGRLTITAPDATPPSAFIIWEGALRLAFDLTQVEGRVEPCELVGDRTARYQVAWEPST